jgi:hypothetical protein
MRAASRAALVAIALAPLASAGEATDGEALAAITGWKKESTASDEKARIAAVDSLARVQHPRVCDALATPLAKDPSNTVRKAAAKALGRQWSRHAVEVLAKPLASADEDLEVKTAILTALGETRLDEAVEPLAGELATRPHAFRSARVASDDPSRLTGPAIAALVRCGSARAIGPLVDFVEAESSSGRTGADPLLLAAEGALKALTGQRPGGGPAGWRAWWNDNKDSLKTVAVYRCEATGELFDKAEGMKCPFDGDKNPRCGVLVHHRSADAPATKK